MRRKVSTSSPQQPGLLTQLERENGTEHPSRLLLVPRHPRAARAHGEDGRVFRSMEKLRLDLSPSELKALGSGTIVLNLETIIWYYYLGGHAILYYMHYT